MSRTSNWSNGARLAAEAAVGHLERDSVLTSRERQVLTLLAAGKTNGEIALAIGISPRTVEGHRTRLGRTLGLRRRAELVEYALLHRLVPLRAAEPEEGRPGTAIDRAGSGSLSGAGGT